MAAPARKPCPICGKTAVQRFAPFCSAACANEDLSRWMSGSYRIPAGAGGIADESEDDSDTDGPPDPPRTH